MATFQVKRYADSPAEYWQAFYTTSIEFAVEKAAAYFCSRDAEYDNFQCFAREDGKTEWQAFNVEVKSEPVFYATKATTP